jgi:hypothetical protein
MAMSSWSVGTMLNTLLAMTPETSPENDLQKKP